MPPAPGADPRVTGERTWPDIPSENYWFRRHLAAYRWVAGRLDDIEGGPLLDAGSGEGYGAAELSRLCRRAVVALELDEIAAAHARRAYPQLASVRANLIAVPMQDGSVAASVSLQVIEHIWDPVTFLRELVRCTAGPIFLSTPNRPVHSPHLGPGQVPDNIFHVREFDATELRELLGSANPLRAPVFYGVEHGPAIVEWERVHGSLPMALLRDPPEFRTMDFAAELTEEDFLVVPLDDASSRAHDLVVSW